MNTFPKYSLGEYVIYEGVLYIITNIHTLDSFKETSFVYGLVEPDANLEKPDKQLFIRENLLSKATTVQVAIWKILYGFK